MFDLIVTVLHIALFSGIVLIALVMLKQGRSVKKKSKLRKDLILLILASSLSQGSYAQAPDPSRGRELSVFFIKGDRVRLVQIPRSPIVFTPVRFCLVKESPSKTDLFNNLFTVRLSGKSGTLSERVFPPLNVELNEWSENLAEFRQTFEFAGDYSIEIRERGVEGTSIALIKVPISIAPFQSLTFDKEIGIFIGGCLVIGGLLFLLWLFLRKSGLDGRVGIKVS